MNLVQQIQHDSPTEHDRRNGRLRGDTPWFCLLKPSESGFTLLEILFVLSIFAFISSGIGLALLSNRTENAVAYYTESLRQSILFARSYALASDAYVTLCPSRQGMTCNQDAYASGWIVFAESDFTEIGKLDDADTLLQVRATANAHIRINTNSYGDGLRFSPKGTITPSGRFVVCWETQVIGAQVLVIASNGRMRVAEDADHDKIPEPFGTNISDCSP